MNIQNLMREAQKMQSELQKTQKELEKNKYEGSSSLVKVVVNGKKEVEQITIAKDEKIEIEDIELLEDMLLVAINTAMKKADEEKEKKLSKYGKGLTGLL